VLLSVACGGLSARQTAPAKDAAVATLDVLLYDGVKNVTAMVAGPDGNLWLATSDGTIARTTMAGETEVFPVGMWQVGGTTLARGPDGYIWLGNYSCSRCSLARVATDGTITEVSVEDALRPVHVLTNAPDGSVWFFGGSQEGGLARVTENGVERARAVTPVDCRHTLFATALVMDPDGNAWLTVWGEGCEEFLRVAPDGQTTQYFYRESACSDCAHAPDFLVIGSDGNVWFHSYAGESASIVRMSPTGSRSLSIASTIYLNDMALGPDGNIWFAPDASYIGRITPAGDESSFALPDGVIAQRIAAGPDGNLWLALEDGRVARVSL
jgi:virginiamycin B lyase